MLTSSHFPRPMVVVASWTALVFVVSVARAERATVSLDGAWEISLDDGKSWRPETVPGTFEEQVDPKFDGVAWLRRVVAAREIPRDHRLLLHFDGVATGATVYFREQEVGRHLGAWTPFRCDVTELARSQPSGSWELRLVVDEKVGHNTQGFLPIIAPHFGGIWQGVRMMVVPGVRFDDLRCLAWGNLQDWSIDLDLPVAGDQLESGDELTIRLLEPAATEWSRPVRIPMSGMPPETSEGQPAAKNGTIRRKVPLREFPDLVASSPQLWSPEAPQRYAARVQLIREGAVRDEVILPLAFRYLEADGRMLRLNGQPLQIRGVLNWGYQQGRSAPTLDPAVMRQEIEFAQQRGFNLMKFCLWVPPRRYLELADELGMLVWMEYPAWHPQFTPQYLKELRLEYDEFFDYDRSHPSIVLRSLTCETGHGADLQVVRSLYEQCHARVPNALVEDDSSWIEWNRVHDFYDDHPYGNNHTWPATLERLNRFIDDRAPKPLVLGEAMAADTWYGPVHTKEPWQDAISPPISAAGNRRWLERLEPLLGPESLQPLRDDSRDYALLMRKYQIETFRREVPAGGYVVSVLRDFSLAGMGLIDYFDRPKWEPNDWQWHGDRMVLLKRAGDARSFLASAPLSGEFVLSQFGSSGLPAGQLEITVRNDDGQTLHAETRDCPPVDPGQLSAPLTFTASLAPLVSAYSQGRPRRVLLEAIWTARGLRTENAWSLWALPDATKPEDIARTGVRKHGSWDLPAACVGARELSAWSRMSPEHRKGPSVVVTRALDLELVDELDRGGRVLLVPNNAPGSMPLRQHWFLRGGPVIAERLVSDRIPRRMLVELQHFDLAGPVVSDWQDLEPIRPLLSLWDNHDIAVVKTHPLVFEMPVGAGLLLVSSLRHDGDGNAVGSWLGAQWVRRLVEATPQESPASRKNAQRLRNELERRELPLHREPWRFQVDATHRGVDQGWHRAEFDDRSWDQLRTDQHWDGQGHANLDGWAWYRRDITVPADWPASQGFLNFTGVDDYYRVYVNGQFVGSGGDLEKRQTAFEERKSHDLGRLIQPAGKLHIAVEVYDWYGAGGIFRPVSLSTTPLPEGTPWLVGP